MAQPDQNPAPAIQLDEALAILKEMDRVLTHHLNWLKTLHRTLICNEPARPDDLHPDAHHLCNFGIWYLNLPKALLDKEPAILELDQPHKFMHDAARELLKLHEQKIPIDSDLYERFMDRAVDFKQRMRAYQFELVQRVCTVDHLTGAWNRNAMTSLLAEEAERARRGQQSCALCLLDLDKFKDINDRFGHPTGDLVLHAVAHFLKDNLRAYDSMFRYGGEEFLICLPDTNLEQAELLINRLRERLSATALNFPDHPEIWVTASFGVAALEPEDEVSLAIERADHALLCAKSKGRNRVCVWDVSEQHGIPAGSPA
ncbi:MAG: diguanylate cyclase [Parasulfuritortus sp.]|nr:diguanylate cyclase [Parasulfuritortus sp.]